MTCEKITKYTLGRFDEVQQWEKQVRSAAENRQWETEISFPKDRNTLQLFMYWVQNCNFIFENETLPQHHNFIFKVKWQPPIPQSWEDLLKDEGTGFDQCKFGELAGFVKE